MSKTETSNELFNTTADETAKSLKGLTTEELLELYALYKIGCGVDITTQSAPGMFSIKEKEKRKAWQTKVDTGLTQEEAQQKYIDRVEQLKNKST